MIPSEFGTVGELRKVAAANAEELLEQNWQEGTFPVDPVKIARRLGVEVYSAQLGNDVFGMLVTGKTTGAQIYLDSDQPEKRLRFTCAHEIGHYIDRNSRLFEGDASYIDRRSDEDRGTPDEIWANEVAGNLLMPAKEVSRAAGEGQDDFSMAAFFGVSVAALRYRKHVLKL